MKISENKKWSYLKIFFIGFLSLASLLPIIMISNLVRERSQRMQEVRNEISTKWAGPQEIAGPIIVIPFEKESTEKIKQAGVEKTVFTYTTQYLHLLPEVTNIKQNISPEIRSRGLYRAIVYNSKSGLNGSFTQVNLAKEGIKPENVKWDKARIVIGVADLKGLGSVPKIIWNNTHLELEANDMDFKIFGGDLSAPVVLNGTTTGKYSLELNLKGSTDMEIAFLGKSNHAEVSGKWADPSFDGSYLPNKREVNKNGFSASWDVQGFDRSLPQQWTNATGGLPTKQEDVQTVKNFNDNSIKVVLLDGIDLYSQTDRTLKYAIIIVILSFLALFFTELINNKTFHIVHYGLIGASLVIFYTLLLSFSEYVGFAPAYAIAFIAILGLISWFVYRISKSGKVTRIVAGILTVFYGFNYVLMQLEDYALLAGSIGMFIILATLMYVASKIDWASDSSKLEI